LGTTVFEDSSGFSDPPHIAAAVSEYLESRLSLAGMHVEGKYRVESHIVFSHIQIEIYYSLIIPWYYPISNKACNLGSLTDFAEESPRFGPHSFTPPTIIPWMRYWDRRFHA
jgi:hypothetical protein